MNSSTKSYCNMIEIIEKERKKVIVKRQKEKNRKRKEIEDQLIKKYDQLFLEKLIILEKMLEKDK